MNTKIILTIIIGLLIIGGVVFLYNSSKRPDLQQSNPIKTESTSDSVSSEDSKTIIDNINTLRTKSGLLEIKFDQNLCAYAKRVALLEAEKDARPGDPPIKNDVESEEVQKTYFPSYSSSLLNLAFYKSKSYNVEMISKDFSSKNSSAMAIDTAGGCVGGVYSNKNAGWVINFVGGSK